MFKLPLFETLEGFMKDARDRSGLRPPGWPIFLLGVLIFFNGYLFFKAQVEQALSFMLFLAPVWLAALVLSTAWGLWMIMIRSYYIAAQNYILLEIRPPRSLMKTPLAMEAVLAGLHHYPGESDWHRLYVRGRVRPWWSLEIVSLRGKCIFISGRVLTFARSSRQLFTHNTRAYRSSRRKITRERSPLTLGMAGWPGDATISTRE